MKKFILFFMMAVSSWLLSQAFFMPVEAEKTPPISTVKPLPLKTEYVPATFTTVMEPSPAEESPISEADIALIALLTMAEAEGECEKGQRLVIDTILNRVDDPHFPDNIYDVVYQKNQYSGIQPPRIERCWVKDELVQLVRDRKSVV